MDEFNKQISSSYTNLVEKLTSWIDLIILQVPNLVVALVVATMAYFFSKYVQRAAEKATAKFTDNRTILHLASNLTTVIFGVIVLFLILSIFDLSSTINKILATAGVLGLAVGLALQDPMTNLFSGIVMSVRDLYTIGDVVKTNGYFGTIKDIDLRVTTILSPTGQIITIPNKDVIQNPLENYTSSGMRRVDIKCGVSYGDNLSEVKNTAESAINQIDTKIEDKPVDLVFTEFGDSSINFTIRFWIETCSQRDFLMEQSKAIQLLKSAFDEKDIMIPFPITTLDFGIRGGTPLDKVINLNSKNGKPRKSLSTQGSYSH